MEVLTRPELIQPVLPIKTASVVGAMVSVYVWCAVHLIMRDWGTYQFYWFYPIGY